MRDDTEQMQRDRMAGRGLQDLPVESFSLGQLAGFVVGDRLLEQAIQR